VYIFNTLQKFLDVINKVPNAVPDQFRIFYGDGAFNEPYANPALSCRIRGGCRGA